MMHRWTVRTHSARWWRVTAMALLAVGVRLAIPTLVRGQDTPVVARPVGGVNAGATAPELDRTFAAHLARVTLREALTVLSAKTGVRLTYSAEQVPLDKVVTLIAESITVRDALAILLEETGLEAAPSRTGAIRIEPRIVGAVSAGMRVLQGTGTIVGRVTDAGTHGPLDQTSIRVEGTSTGAATASDGRYAIAGVALGVYHVTARRVGYTPLTQTVTVGSDSTSTVDFALAAVPTKLNEVVTTAVGDQRRYEVGNVISTINADSIAPTAPITSLTDLISARAPGVEVIETGGLVGSGESIRIRGQSSLVLQGDPIVIVDGIRQDNTPGGTNFAGTFAPSPSRLNDLDFSQIETINILKGPAASTEYGTDAANGVIVIVTKHGTAGRPRWLASAEQTASGIPTTFPNYYYRWGHTTDGTNSPVECPLVPIGGGTIGSTTGTCKVDSVTRFNPLNHPYYSTLGTGARAKYDLQVSGGSETLRYFLAGALSNETGIARLPSVFDAQAAALSYPVSAFKPNDEGQRSVRANMAMQVGRTIDIAVNSAYLSTHQSAPGGGQLSLGPTTGVVLPDSAHFYGYGNVFYSPLVQAAQVNTQQTDRLTGSLAANWRPAPWFVAHGTLGVDHGSQELEYRGLPQAAIVEFGGTNGGSLAIGDQGTNIYSGDLRASATMPIAAGVRTTTSIGVQLVDTRTQGVAASAEGLSSTNLALNGATNPAVTQIGNRNATLGGYGEELVAVADRLFLTGALRIDAASGFGGAYHTAAYPKTSVSWVALSRGGTTVRVRGALGQSGVQPYNGAALQLYRQQVEWLGGGPASVVEIGQPGNPTLKPERSTEYEGGMDVGLWGNRTSLEVTSYSKTTQDALIDTQLGWELGGYGYETNIGEVRNTGVEAMLTTTIVQGATVTWDVSLNASVNHNKLVRLAAGMSTVPSPVAITQRQVVGYPLYGYWGSREQYVDGNHDGIVEAADVSVADSASYQGSSIPTREASGATHVSFWRGALTVGALVDYRGGYRVFNSSAYGASQSGTLREQNDPTAPLWLQARAVAVPLCVVGATCTPSGFFEDGTFLRVREISLTYTIPRRWSRAMRLQRLSLTGAARNVALWTRYSGPDPEVGVGGGGASPFSPTGVNNDIRADVGTVPLARYWVARLNVEL